MNTKYYYLSENDNLLEELINLDFPVSTYSKQLKIIGAKARNNKVGFAQFGNATNRHVLCVCPKNSSKDHDSLFSYLRIAMVIAKRNHRKVVKIDRSLFDLSHRLGTGHSELNSLDDLVYVDCNNILDDVYAMMVRLKSVSENRLDFSSPSIKNTLVMTRNAQELDKSKVHQKVKRYTSESIIADYTVEVLKFFSAKRYKDIEQGEVLRNKSNKIHAFIRRRFKINSRGAVLSKFHTTPIRKTFSSMRAKNLYLSLLKLIGIPGFIGGRMPLLKSSISVESLYTFFVNPELIYELYIYETIKRYFPKHRVDYNPRKSFSLFLPNGETLKKIAQPDVVLYGSRYIRVIDVKWKCVLRDSDIEYNDVVKLKRDYDIYGGDFAALVYPVVASHLIGIHKMELGDGSTFEFRVFQHNYIS